MAIEADDPGVKLAEVILYLDLCRILYDVGIGHEIAFAVNKKASLAIDY